MPGCMHQRDVHARMPCGTLAPNANARDSDLTQSRDVARCSPELQLCITVACCVALLSLSLHSGLQISMSAVLFSWYVHMQ